MATKVIFRTFKDGEVIAIFPTIPGTADAGTCTDYVHYGQHGTCIPEGVVNTTRLATEEEYSPLLHELVETVGYGDLVIRKKLNPADREARAAELRRTEA